MKAEDIEKMKTGTEDAMYQYRYDARTVAT